MKTRIQIAGGDYGVAENVQWKGELPFIPGAHPGMRIVVMMKDRVEGEDETTVVYKVTQTALEINVAGDYEQVVYVFPTERKAEPQPLMG